MFVILRNDSSDSNESFLKIYSLSYYWIYNKNDMANTQSISQSAMDRFFVSHKY